jgi:hypothetical protein
MKEALQNRIASDDLRSEGDVRFEAGLGSRQRLEEDDSNLKRYYE